MDGPVVAMPSRERAPGATVPAGGHESVGAGCGQRCRRFVSDQRDLEIDGRTRNPLVGDINSVPRRESLVADGRLGLTQDVHLSGGC